MSQKLRLKKPFMVFGLLIIAILAATMVMQPIQHGMTIAVPGWEIYNQIAAMQYPSGVKSGSSDFPSGQAFVSGPMWKVDDVALCSVIPTIMVQTGDIRHVDFTGMVTPNTEPAKTITKTIGNHTYTLDYHIYMFDISIRTIADYKQVSTSLLGVPVYAHETSWADMSSDPLPGGVSSGQVGKQFDGGVYVKFVFSPWRGDNTSPPENYVLSNAWAGTMNAYVFSKEQGQVSNQWGDLPTPSNGAELFVKGGLDNGAQVPMFKDDGQYGNTAPRTNWDNNVSPDTRINSNVVLYLPVQEEAGAYLTKHWLTSETIGVAPCDVYVKYTLRIDVLQAHDFVLQTAYNAPTLAPPTDFYSWTKSFWDAFNDSGWWYIIFIALVLLAALWVVMKNRRAR